MSFFSYRAIDRNGKQLRGTLHAESSAEVMNELAGRGYYLLSVKPASEFMGQLSRRLRQYRVTRSEVIELSSNLSVMISAGIPLTVALGDIMAATANQTLADILSAIRQSVEQGTTFSDAVERHGDIFPDIFIRLVRIGEETGSFDKSLADIAEHLQRMEDLSAAIKRALLYPTFAIVTTLGALVFWMVFVLPKIITTIKGMGVKLPLITRMLMGTSELMQRYWLYTPLVVMLLLLLFKAYTRSEKGRLQVDRLKLSLPIYKLVEYNRLLALFAEQMRILIVAGLTVDRTLGILGSVMKNEVFRRAIVAVREDITYGSTISDAMRKHPVFPPLTMRMVGIGETSGTLDDQFAFLARQYLKKLDDISDKLGKIIEPVVIGLIGLLFAIIILGLMLPVYELVSKVGKG